LPTGTFGKTQRRRGEHSTNLKKTMGKNTVVVTSSYRYMNSENNKLLWPTLEGRLKQPLTSEKQALEQLKQSGIQLSEYGEKLLEKFLNVKS
jgi:hypothetical protein